MQVTRIRARVADNYESGTDCSVFLRLHNAGTTCGTKILDGPGNSWVRDGSEDYSFKEAENVCTHDNFRPGNNLQFKFYLHRSCIDHMQLTWVRVYFGGKYYEWSGQHWWTPRAKWMDFDSWSCCV